MGRGKVETQRGGVVPGWITAVVTIGAVLLVLGAVLAVAKPSMLLAPGEPVTSGVRVYAGYLFSRNLALGLLLLAGLTRRLRANLSGMIELYALIQVFDATIDCVEGRWMVLPPVVLLGLLFGWMWIRLQDPETRSAMARK